MSTDTYQTTKTLLKEKNKEYKHKIENQKKNTGQIIYYPNLLNKTFQHSHKTITPALINKHRIKQPKSKINHHRASPSQKKHLYHNNSTPTKLAQSSSPPVITKTFTSTTPHTIDTLTPAISESQTKTHKLDDDNIFPTLHKKGKIIKRETALKMTQKLTKMSYRDTGFLSNTTEEERKQIMALFMYYQIGRFDPSNIFIVSYKNKNIINLVKLHMRNKLHKELPLTKIYMYLYDKEQRMEINKANKDKNKKQ